MRLINIHTLQLKEFMPDAIPPFAILSHTWEADEVSYGDMMNNDRSLLDKKQGYHKIVNFCHFVEKYSHRYDHRSETWLRYNPLPRTLDYVWVDTCCIDKTSSAELSEAINSMYAWYSISEYCVAYLGDYTHNQNVAGMASRWYTRGWTLQELLAPRKLIFVDQNWREFGSKDSLADRVAEASGIDRWVFAAGAPSRTLNEMPIAMRMSWAAKRETTRPEDMAYCLLGLFQVNMPLLYGEGGERAFIRLQEEIIKESDDQSIFAWNPSQDREYQSVYLGALATHPSEFVGTWGCESLPGAEEPHNVTSRGIKLHLQLVADERHKSGVDESGVVGILQCQNILNRSLPKRYGIPLRLVPGSESAQLEVYGRDARPLVLMDSISLYGQGKMQEIYLLKRTKVLDDLSVSAEIHVPQMKVVGNMTNIFLDTKMAVYTPHPQNSERNLYPAGWDTRVGGTVELGLDRKATVFFQPSSQDPISSSFMLGIVRDVDVRVVLRTFQHRGPLEHMTFEDGAALHTELHGFEKARNAYLEIPRKAPGLMRGVFQASSSSRDALIEAAVDCEIVDTLGRQLGRIYHVRLGVSFT